MKKFFALFLSLLSTTSLLKAGGSFKPRDADTNTIEKKIARHTHKAKTKELSAQKAEYHTTQISTLRELQKAKALHDGDELKQILLLSADEAYHHTKSLNPKSTKLDVQEDNPSGHLRFHSMNEINRNPGKYMVVGCYNGYQADDHSDHSHKDAVTIKIPYDKDPFKDVMDPHEPNRADIKEDISDPLFLNNPAVRPLIGTLDTVYLERITTEPLIKPHTYTNALALLKEGGKLYFDDYSQIGEAEIREVIRSGSTEAERDKKRLEISLRQLGFLKDLFEKRYKLNMRNFKVFRSGVNPFNKRAEGILVMVEKGTSKSSMVQLSPKLDRKEADNSPVNNKTYTPTTSAREALEQVRSLIGQKVIDPKGFTISQMVEMVTDPTTFGSLKGQGLKWISDQLK